MAPQPTDTTTENDPQPASKRGFLEGWLVSLIIHCTVLLALALLAIPAGSALLDSSVLILGPQSDASDALFSLNSDPLTFEAESETEILEVVQPVLPLVRSADIVEAQPADAIPAPSDLISQLVDLDVGGDSAKDGDAVFFGTSASGRDFVFILDCSGSMRARGNDRFIRARDELVNSISKLRPDQRFYVYLFNWSTFPMFSNDHPQVLIAANGENLAKLRAWLYSIQPDSGTDPRRALRGSLAMQPDAIFLLSDGKFNKPTSTNLLLGWDSSPSSVYDIFSGDASPDVQVNTIAFEDQVAAVGMEKLAKMTNGQFRFVASPGQEQSGPVDTQVAPESLPQTPAEKLALAKQVLLIRRAEKLVERDRGKHAAELIKDIDENELPSEVRARVLRIRRIGRT